MPTFYSSTESKRKLPEYVAANVTNMYLCKAPLKTDTVAQIIAKSIATAPFTGADIAISVDGEKVVATFAAKNNLTPSGSAADTEDLATVYCSGSLNLLCIDAADRVITNESGDTISISAASYEVPDPIAKV